MFRVIYSETDQTVVRVPIDPATGEPILLSGTVTVTFLDKREGESTETIGSATVSQDSTSAVLTASAGYGQADPCLVPISPSLVSEGHLYLIQGGGNSELFRVRETTSTEVFAVDGLRHQYSSTDANYVRGIEVVATFPDLTADTEAVKSGGGPYLVTWSYVHDGSTVVLADTAYLDRYSLAPFIDEAYVLMADPTISERSRGRTRVSQAIAVAWQDYLAEVESADKDPSLIIPSNGAKVALRHGALAYLLEWNSGVDEDPKVASERRLFQSGMRDFLTGRPPKGTAEIDRDTDKAVTPKSGFEFIRRS